MDFRRKMLIFVFAFLFIFLFLHLFLIFIHERGHIIEAKKNNISFDMEINNIFQKSENAPNFISLPKNTVECEKFNSLPEEKRVKIAQAGVRAEFGVSAFFILICMMVLFSLRKDKSNRMWVVYCIVAAVLIRIVMSIYYNVIDDNMLNDWRAVLFDCKQIIYPSG